MAKANKPAAKSTTKPASKPMELSPEARLALNDKARYDYGIMNADEMSEKQLKSEMKAIDDQAKS